MFKKLVQIVVLVLFFGASFTTMAQESQPSFSVEFGPVIKDEKIQVGVYKLILVGVSQEGTARLTYTCQGETVLTDEMKEKRAWGDWNIATPDSPEFRPNEWVTKIWDGCSTPVSHIFVLIRSDEGGWSKALVTDITEQWIERIELYARAEGEGRLLSEANVAGMVISEVSSGDEFLVITVEGNWVLVRRLLDDNYGWVQIESLQLATYGTEQMRRYGDTCWVNPERVVASDRFRWRWQAEFPESLPEDAGLFFYGDYMYAGTDYRRDEYQNVIQVSNAFLAAHPGVTLGKTQEWIAVYSCDE